MPESIFLAERYIARLGAAEFRALADSLTVATAAMRAEGHRIRWVRSYGVLDDEACLCVFLADNVADVEEANRRAGAEWERIIPAFVLENEQH
jgi:hypothetical protein